MKKLIGGLCLTVAAGAAIAGITGASQDAAATKPVSAVLGGLERSSLFVSAAARVDLDRHADGARPWILFVPSDRALRSEGSAFLLETVLPAPANEERLAAVIGYHLVPGARFDAVASSGETTLHTASGQPLVLERLDATWRVDGHVAVLDTMSVGDGTVVVVDRLLWPSDPPRAASASSERGGPHSGREHGK